MSSREIDSNQLMIQAVCRRFESIQLMIKTAFQGIDSESTHDSSGSPDIDSNRLMSQAKNIWFWVDSWFNSESYPCLHHSHHSHRNRSGIMRWLATTLHALTLVKQSWCIVLLSELSRLRSDLHSVLWEHDTLTPQGEAWRNVRRTITCRSSSKNFTQLPDTSHQIPSRTSINICHWSSRVFDAAFPPLAACQIKVGGAPKDTEFRVAHCLWLMWAR